MADITQVADLNIFQWSTPDNPRPRLANPIKAADTTITFTAAPLDESGSVITGNFLFGIQNSSGYIENVYVPATKMSADGLTASDVIRGVRLEGLDYTTGDSSLASDHDQDSPVFCNVAAFIGTMFLKAQLGEIGADLKLVDRLDYTTDGILAAQSFADATARDTAYTSPVVGDLCFKEDTEDLQIYLTAGWTDLGLETASSAKTQVIADASAANGELYRSSDDSNSLYYKDNAGNSIKLIDITSQKIDSGILDIASEAEAKAGTDNEKVMTPLRTEQAIIDPYAAKGDLVVGTGAEARDVLNVGADDKVLVADSGETTGLNWATKTEMTSGTINGVTTQTVTHGLGKTPTIILFNFYGVGVTNNWSSSGDHTNKCAYTSYSGVGINNYAGYIGANSGNYIQFTVSNITSTTFDITVASSGSVSNALIWQAIA